jgi:hypothetical protein
MCVVYVKQRVEGDGIQERYVHRPVSVLLNPPQLLQLVSDGCEHLSLSFHLIMSESTACSAVKERRR